MKLRHLAAWFSGVALLGTGATILWAQPAQPQRVTPARTEREKFRAEIVKVRTEVEVLRFDYELLRDGVLEELKLSRSTSLAGQIMGAIGNLQVSINETRSGAARLGSGAGIRARPEKSSRGSEACGSR